MMLWIVGGRAVAGWYSVIVVIQRQQPPPCAPSNGCKAPRQGGGSVQADDHIPVPIHESTLGLGGRELGTRDGAQTVPLQKGILYGDQAELGCVWELDLLVDMLCLAPLQQLESLGQTRTPANPACPQVCDVAHWRLQACLTR